MSRTKVKKVNQKEKRINIILLIVSILLFVIALILKNVTLFRTFLVIISLLILLYIVYRITKSFRFIPSSFIVFLIIFIMIDSAWSFAYKRVPVFSFNIITSGNVRVYNSIGYRVWQCDKNNYKNVIVDPFYNKGYICDSDSLDVIDANSFLSSVVENYDEYKNNFVKIRGKISRKNSLNFIEMQPYENSSITVNGYVNFFDNITLKIIFNELEPVLDSYDIYDEIIVVGTIKKMEVEDNKYTVSMYDSKIVSDLILNDFTVNVTSPKKCSGDKKLIYQDDEVNFYTYCIDEAIVNYGSHKYELATALSSKKIEVNELYDNLVTKMVNEDDDSLIYQGKNYSVLVCGNGSKNIIMSNTKLDFKNNFCTIQKENED